MIPVAYSTMAAVLCWWGLNEQGLVPHGPPKGCASPLCNTSSQRRTETGNHLPSLPPRAMKDAGDAGHKKCLGNGAGTGKGQWELPAFRWEETSSERLKLVSATATLFPPGKGVDNSRTVHKARECAGTGCASTAKDHHLDLGLTLSYGDLNTSPLQPGWTQYEMLP